MGSVDVNIIFMIWHEQQGYWSQTTTSSSHKIWENWPTWFWPYKQSILLTACLPLQVDEIFFQKFSGSVRSWQRPTLLEKGTVGLPEATKDTMIAAWAFSFCLESCACALILTIAEGGQTKATTCNIAENKRNILSHNICSTNIFDREQTSCNMIQQHATWYNNTQQGGQTVQTFSSQQMLHVVAWKVGIVWPGLKVCFKSFVT